VGYNNIDVQAAGQRGLVVCNVPDYGTEEVADHAIMLLLAAHRGLIASDAAIRRGGWDLGPIQPATRLRGRTLALIGFGRIGQATALRARAFGLDVVVYDPYQPDGVDKALGVRRADSLAESLAQADFVSLHCLLSDETRHLINAASLRAMRPGAVLVNTARGGLVDEDALADALARGALRAAALDVLACEPPPAQARLLALPNVLVTPHVAGLSERSVHEMTRRATDAVLAVLAGDEPPGLVRA
jgi:C-terminal binding protein